MDTQDIIKATQSTKRLIQDDNYYKYIFKKTERIVSVVFYIVHTIKDNNKNGAQIADLETVARSAHDAVLASLSSRAHIAEELVRETAQSLVVLMSKLTVAQMSQLITTEVYAVIQNEADSVLRALTPYLGEEAVVFEQLGSTQSARTRVQSTPRPTTARANSDVAQAALTTLSDSDRRQAQIKAIVETQGEVSIKDVSTIVTDVSEKTIQRELNDMIDKNILKRIGERRWSKYVLF